MPDPLHLCTFLLLPFPALPIRSAFLPAEDPGVQNWAFATALSVTLCITPASATSESRSQQTQSSKGSSAHSSTDGVMLAPRRSFSITAAQCGAPNTCQCMAQEQDTLRASTGRLSDGVSGLSESPPSYSSPRTLPSTHGDPHHTEAEPLTETSPLAKMAFKCWRSSLPAEGGSGGCLGDHHLHSTEA